MPADELETLARTNGGGEVSAPNAPVPDNAPPRRMDGGGESVIRLDDVYKGFGTGSKRIDPIAGVTLDVVRGETLVVIGPSGTGKSVMLRLMLGLLDPDQGEVYVFGRKIREMTDDQLAATRKRMAMLFQGGALFDSMTVGDNVAFPLRAMGEKDEDKIHRIVTERLRQVGLPGTGEKLPSELSGGMKKRAALARSIAVNPEIILYDEPTTGLDPIMSDAIGDLIKDTHASLKDTNVTSIVVTHDMHLAVKIADRIVMLYDGRVVADGPPELYRRLGRDDELPDGASDRMIRQFVRGEADGPIRPVA